MARARGARRVRKSGSMIWTAVMRGPNSALAAATQVATDIVIASDYQGAGTGQEEATLLSVRGYISVVTDAATDGAFQWLIATVDEDTVDTAAEMAPGTVNTYVDEDILMTGGYQFEASFTEPYTWDVHVKSMRKLKRGRDVRLFMLANTTAVRVTSLLRGLLKVG